MSGWKLTRVAQTLILIFTIGLKQSHAFLEQGETPGFRECHMLIVDCKIQNRNTRCLLDTGATQTAVSELISREWPTSTSPAARVTMHEAVLLVPVHENITIHAAGFPPQKLPVLQVDLAKISEFAGQEVGAVVGWDIVGSSVLVFGGAEPLFLDKVPEHFADSKIMSVRYSQHGATLPLELPLVGVRDFVIDTGCNYSLTIQSSLADILLRAGEAVHAGSSEMADGNSGRQRNELIIREVKFLHSRFQNVPARISNMNVVGIQILERFEAAIDFKKLECHYFDTIATDSSPIPVSASGLGFVFRGRDSLFVFSVRKNSVADDAGVKEGDEILSLNGKSPSAFSRKGVQMLFSQAGQTVHLFLKRGDESLGVDLILRHDFEYPPKWATAQGDAKDFQNSLQIEVKE